MKEDKKTPQTSILYVLRAQTTLIPNVNNVPLAAVSFSLLLGENGQIYRATYACTDIQNENSTDFLHNDAVYSSMRDGDKIKAVVRDNKIVEIVENLTLKKEITKYLNSKGKNR